MNDATRDLPAATCPECGAPIMDGLTCWDKLGHLLAWEAQDSALMAVHFLTVASYNLQHPAQFTDDATAALKVALVDFLDNGTPVAELRRRMNTAYAGVRRVVRSESERSVMLRRWTLTIDHAFAGGDPVGAATHVQQWAAAIRQDLDSGGE
jgi:hypothetical protein